MHDTAMSARMLQRALRSQQILKLHGAVPPKEEEEEDDEGEDEDEDEDEEKYLENQGTETISNSFDLLEIAVIFFVLYLIN